MLEQNNRDKDRQDKGYRTKKCNFFSLVGFKDLALVYNLARKQIDRYKMKRRKIFLQCDAIRWEQYFRRCRLEQL